jgi:hypothetical protein
LTKLLTIDESNAQHCDILSGFPGPSNYECKDVPSQHEASSTSARASAGDDVAVTPQRPDELDLILIDRAIDDTTPDALADEFRSIILTDRAFSRKFSAVTARIFLPTIYEGCSSDSVEIPRPLHCKNSVTNSAILQSESAESLVFELPHFYGHLTLTVPKSTLDMIDNFRPPHKRDFNTRESNTSLQMKPKFKPFDSGENQLLITFEEPISFPYLQNTTRTINELGLVETCLDETQNLSPQLFSYFINTNKCPYKYVYNEANCATTSSRRHGTNFKFKSSTLKEYERYVSNQRHLPFHALRGNCLIRLISPISLLDLVGWFRERSHDQIALLFTLFPFSSFNIGEYCEKLAPKHCSACDDLLGRVGLLLNNAYFRVHAQARHLNLDLLITPNDVGIYGEIYDLEHAALDTSSTPDLCTFDAFIQENYTTFLCANITMCHEPRDYKYQNTNDLYRLWYPNTCIYDSYVTNTLKGKRRGTGSRMPFDDWLSLFPFARKEHYDRDLFEIYLRHLYNSACTALDFLPTYEEDGRIIIHSPLYPPTVGNPELPPGAEALSLLSLDFLQTIVDEPAVTDGAAIGSIATVKHRESKQNEPVLDALFYNNFDSLVKHSGYAGGISLTGESQRNSDTYFIKYGVPVPVEDNPFESFNNVGDMPINFNLLNLLSHVTDALLLSAIGNITLEPIELSEMAWAPQSSAGFPFSTKGSAVRTPLINAFDCLLKSDAEWPIGIATAHKKKAITEKMKERSILAPNLLSQFYQKFLTYPLNKALNSCPDLTYKGGQSLHGGRYERYIQSIEDPLRSTYVSDLPSCDSKANPLFQLNYLRSASKMTFNGPQAAKMFGGSRTARRKGKQLVKYSYLTSAYSLFLFTRILWLKISGVMSGSAFTAPCNWAFAAQSLITVFIMYVLTSDVDVRLRARLFVVVYCDAPVTIDLVKEILHAMQCNGVGDDLINSLRFELDFEKFYRLSTVFGGYEMRGKISKVEPGGIITGYCSHVAFRVTNFYGGTIVLATVPSSRIIGSALWNPSGVRDPYVLLAKFHGLTLSGWNNTLRDVPFCERMIPLLTYALSLSFTDLKSEFETDVDDFSDVAHALSLSRIHQHCAGPTIPFPIELCRQFCAYYTYIDSAVAAVISEQIDIIEKDVEQTFKVINSQKAKATLQAESRSYECSFCGVDTTLTCECGLKLCRTLNGSCAFHHARNLKHTLNETSTRIRCSHTNDLTKLFIANNGGRLRLSCVECKSYVSGSAPLVTDGIFNTGSTSSQWLFSSCPNSCGDMSKMFEINMYQLTILKRKASLAPLLETVSTCTDKPVTYRKAKLVLSANNLFYYQSDMTFRQTSSYSYRTAQGFIAPWPITYADGKYITSTRLPADSEVFDSTSFDLRPNASFIRQNMDWDIFANITRPNDAATAIPDAIHRPVTHICGPPGCGKTYNAIKLIKVFITKTDVLLVADSHQVADEITTILDSIGIKVFRLIPRVSETYTPQVPIHTIIDKAPNGNLTRHVLIKTTKASLVRKYPVLIIEEAGLNNIILELYSIMYHKPRHTVFVGDPVQRAPIMNIQVLPLHTNFFNYAFELKSHHILTDCYRCPIKVVEFFSKAFYNGAVIAKSNIVGIFKLVKLPECKHEVSLDDIALIGSYISGNTVIITPTNHAANTMRSHFRNTSIRVGTVDSAQGSEWDTVLVVLQGSNHRENLLPSRVNVAVSRVKQKLIIFYGHDRVIDFVKKYADVESESPTVSSVQSTSDELADFKYTLQSESLYVPTNRVETIGTSEVPDATDDATIESSHNTVSALGQKWHKRYFGTPCTISPGSIIAVDCEFVFCGLDKIEGQKIRQHVAQVATYNYSGRSLDLHIVPLLPFHEDRRTSNYFDAPGFDYWKKNKRRKDRINHRQAILAFLQHVKVCEPYGRVAFLTKSGRLDWGFLGLMATDLGATTCDNYKCSNFATFFQRGRSYCCAHTEIDVHTKLIQPWTVDLDDLFCYKKENSYDLSLDKQTPSLTRMHETFCTVTHGIAHDALCDARMTFCVYEHMPHSTVFVIGRSKPLHASLKRHLRAVLPDDTYYLGGGKALGDSPYNIDSRFGKDLRSFEPPEDATCIYVDSHYYTEKLIANAYVLGNDSTIRVIGHKLTYFKGNNHFYVHDVQPVALSSLCRAYLKTPNECAGELQPDGFRHFVAQFCADNKFCKKHSTNYRIFDGYLDECKLLFRQVPSAQASLKYRLTPIPQVGAACPAIETPPHAIAKLHNDTRKKLYGMLCEASLGSIPSNASILTVGGHNTSRNLCHYAAHLSELFPFVSCSELSDAPNCPNFVGSVPISQTPRYDFIVSDMYPIDEQHVENLISLLKPGGSISFKITNQVIQDNNFDQFASKFQRAAIFTVAQRSFSTEAFIVLNNLGQTPKSVPFLRNTYNHYLKKYIADGELRATDNYLSAAKIRAAPKA